MIGERLKFIWGIKSADDCSGRPCDLYTLNDFDIFYDRATKRYNYDIELAYDFRTRERQLDYLKYIYKEFTMWMRKKGHNTRYKPFIYDFFGYNRETEGFETLEELYAVFRMKCIGFAAVISNKKKQEDKNGTL